MTFSPLNYRPRTTFADVRRPTEQEWEKWATMPQLPLWKAVALLCEIEPSSLPEAEVVWRTAVAGTPASRFYDRLEAAEEHIRTGSLPSARSHGDSRKDLLVRTADFAGWVHGMGWALPSEVAQSWGDVPTAVPSAVSTSAGPWPWGTYETDLLRVLAKAAAKFWADFDPSAPAKADMNKAVAAWLQEQKLSDGEPVSERLANAMATILRAPGIPSGPRSK